MAKSKKEKKNAIKSEESSVKVEVLPEVKEVFQIRRRKLPDERKSITHKFSIAGHEGYLNVGVFEDGTPGEIFIRMSKRGSTISGLMDSFALAISLSLQYGVPLQVLVDKYIYTRFEPAGFTTNFQIRNATSIVDYIFKWLALKFLNKNFLESSPIISKENDYKEITTQTDAPPCYDCGTIMIRNGSCYKCPNCGSQGGCG